MESKGTGRVVAYDPRTQQSRVIAKGLVFPNGVAMHPDGSVLVNETGRYRTLKIDPGTFLLGLISPRSEWLDANAAKPGARKFAMRLPASMRPKAVPYVHIVQLNADGEVLRTLQDPSGAYHEATGAIVHDGQLYVTSLLETDLARRPYSPLK